MQIVYAEDHEEIREIYTLLLESIFPGAVIACESGSELIEVLSSGIEVDCILTDYMMNNGTGLDVYQYIVKRDLDIPFIMFTGDESIEELGFSDVLDRNPNNQLIAKPPRDIDFEKVLHFLLPKKEAEKAEFEDSDEIEESGFTGQESIFVPFRLKILLRAEEAPADIYVRLGEGHFVQILKDGESLDNEDIKKYQRRKLEYVYVEEEGMDKLLNTFVHIANDIFDEEIKGQANAVYEKQLFIQEIVHSQLNNLGIEKDLIDISKEQVDASLDFANQRPTIKSLIRQIMGKTNFHYEHSLMLGYICSLVLKNLEWESRDNHYKIFLAALFHDMSLESNDVYEEMELSGVDKEKHSEEDIAIYENHPMESAEFIKTFRGIPPDVSSIIGQHHELPKCKGFPRGLSSPRTFPLAKVFIVSHYFVAHIYKTGCSPESLELCLDEMDQIFEDQSYNITFQAFKQVFHVGDPSL